jgi:hypothetical protein
MSAPCEPCAHAAAQGWWGPLPDGATTHCRRCHRGWSGAGQVHCSRCCRHFSADSALRLHRGPNGCADPATITTQTGTPRLERREDRFGVVWGWPGERRDGWASRLGNERMAS